MRYSKDTLEDIRLGNDIIDIINMYTPLKQKGNSYFGLCPFHKESTPSFSVSSEKQLYHCFGCGASGTVFNFIMDIENFDFLDTVKFLANRINYKLPEFNISKEESNKLTYLKNRLYDMHKLVARKYYDNLNTKEGAIANAYLDKRKISPLIRKKYGLGYSLKKNNDIYNFLKQKDFTETEILESGLIVKDKKGIFYDRFYGRLMFPIIDVQGRIIGFGGRDLYDKENAAKYLNSPDTKIFNKSYNLYSMNFAKLSKTKEFILVEGYIDVIALYQIGITNVVASLGTAFNERHALTLKKYTNSVIILFDSDEPGVKAALKTIPILTKNGIKPKVLQVPKAKDPDEYIKKFGEKSFKDLLPKAKHYIIFEINQVLKKYNIDNIDEKIDCTKEIAKIISKLDSDMEKELFVKEASKITSVSAENIYKEIENFSQKNSINIVQKKYTKSKTTINDKYDNAKKGMLYLLAFNKDIFNSFKDYIKPEHFLDKEYYELAKIIFDYNQNNVNISPAEIINKFENTEVQQKISKVFMQKIDLTELENKEKIINDYYKLIEIEYIDFKINTFLNNNNLEKVNYYINKKKQLDKIHIKL